jgi:hypothetical protein
MMTAPAGRALASARPLPPAAAAAPASLNNGDGVPASADTASAAALCAQDAYKAGFPYNQDVAGYPSIVVAVAIGLAESGCNPSATNTNGPTSGCPNGSTDQGLWQVNNCYQAQVGSSCAFNGMCNAIAAYQISDKGTSYTPWATYSSGTYKGYLSAAQAAISGLTVTLFNKSTNLCLGADSADTSNGAPVFQWSCNSSNPYEQWRVKVVSDNLQVLQNVGTGTCLDGDGTDSGNGAPVFQWNCSADTSAFENWILGPSGSRSDYANATLYNWGDKDCLANDSADIGNGAPIFQWACDSSNGWEQWT